MLSLVGHSSPSSSTEAETLKKPKPPFEEPTRPNHVFSHIPPTRTTLLLFLILLQFLLILYIIHSPQTNHSPPIPSPIHVAADSDCHARRIYVYDLPTIFNHVFKERCDELDPWTNKCDAFLNDGLGASAADDVAGIVPEEVLPAWYWTDHYWGEVIFHNRMLNYKCRTMEPESATAFYIPFYVGLSVGKLLWGNYSAKERDWSSLMMMNWVQDQKWWKRSNGSDHIIMLGRLTWDFRRLINSDNDWGTSLLHMPAMRNIIRICVERNPWDHLEIAVPYPTVFHPRTAADTLSWQNFIRNRNRTSLFTFVGGARRTIQNDFRGLLLNQCLNDSGGTCHHVDCARSGCVNGTTKIMEAFLSSDFCLQPRGDGYTRRSVFDCMLSGSIPVFFWTRTAYEQYEWFMPSDPSSYSVFIDRREVRNGTSIRKVLESYSRGRIKRMREKVMENIPNFVYANPGRHGLGTAAATVRDAFDITVDGIMNKYKDHMQRGGRGRRRRRLQNEG
ncbi:xyloglucan galactosyltransferase XLT2-like [Impatiens glandulifera]|uniref:xyloglucan galactosyltransferase XLT2-like n=1 Tax=Impatiens glandulifera TaxID=253017 RepID=UPI001FB1651E|nr:xyloglucan galactosyltransferase XLT2-like [Impatiens glandulifera]